MSARGQTRKSARLRGTSGIPSILLQKSRIASVRILGEILNRAAIDDSDNLSRATEVAYEFCVGLCGPSDLYTKNAPAALRNFETFGKATFATLSRVQRTCRAGRNTSDYDPGCVKTPKSNFRGERLSRLR